MKTLLSEKFAANTLLTIFALLGIFHLLMLFNLLPENIVWGGGAVGSNTNFRLLETISLVVTLIYGVIVAVRVGYLSLHRFKRTITALLWFMFAYLLFNTVGNLASSSSTERWVLTPVTILAALLVLRLLLIKKIPT